MEPGAYLQRPRGAWLLIGGTGTRFRSQMRRTTGPAPGKGNAVMTTEAVRMRDGPPVADLVTRAIAGDSQAWDALVERYIPLVWSICRGHRIDHADARTVGQTVWRQLAGQLDTLRDPAALAGWLATTTHHEC